MKPKSDQAKILMQSLRDSIWIFSALTALAETGGIRALKNDVSPDELQKITQLPLEVLQGILSLLVSTEFLVKKETTYGLTPSMLALIQEDGIDNLLAQLRLIFGTSREFILDARARKLEQGWRHTDPFILQSIGRLSQFVANEFVPQNPQLKKMLEHPGAQFLDVGTGTANIAIRLCQLYPNLHVTGIDPAKKPFELAQKNIAQTPFQGRINLKKIHLQELIQENFFDVIWIPQAFLSDEILKEGLNVAWKALKPGGMLLSAALELKDSLSAHVTQLISAVYGSNRSTSTFLKLLEESHFLDCKVFAEIYGYQVVTASKTK